MGRFVTFRFDDGFVEGARKAVARLDPSHATFFIVTGLVAGSHRLDHIPLFRGRNFGSLNDWRAIGELGHDIQPHSVTHPKFTELTPEAQIVEVQESAAFVRDIHSGPYVFCFPYNTISQMKLSSLGLSAAGFDDAMSDRPVAFNLLGGGKIDLFRLRSWTVIERHFDTISYQLERLPNDSWTILALHSLDGEGWEPWTSEGFARLVAKVRAARLQIVTVREMINAIIGELGVVSTSGIS